MTNETRRVRKERKRAEANERQTRYDALSHDEKTARALGRGHAMTREYRRLTGR